ncbi:hypothetical protein SynMEDNS5_01797 [Synechococcus sp. MEDNS5]|nr:hypothetical protein SynMEDNS5_01797 [Synechococcus sp. MEDNS5]
MFYCNLLVIQQNFLQVRTDGVFPRYLAGTVRRRLLHLLPC